MSQVLSIRPKNSFLHQDVVLSKPRFTIPTKATPANCFVCGKGLEDGYSLTAKRSQSETVLLCDKHFY